MGCGLRVKRSPQRKSTRLEATGKSATKGDDIDEGQESGHLKIVV